MPGISKHAIERFIQRVSVTDDPKSSIAKMWSDGREPKFYEYGPFRCYWRDGTRYRICEHNGRTYLLLEREDCVVTILDQQTRAEIARVKR